MSHRRRGASVLVIGFVALAATNLIGCGAAPVPSATDSATAPAATPEPPASTPGPSAEPTFLSTGQPTLRPSVFPSIVPPTPPMQSLDPVFGDLLPHIPEDIRASCQDTTPLEPVSASLACIVGDGGVTVEYAKYPDRDSMYAAYNGRVGIAEIETDSGLCYDSVGGTIGATPGRWPAEHDYSINGSAVGRYLCLELDVPAITWTDERFNILAEAVVSTGDVDLLVAFWLNEAGPIP